MKKHSDDWLNRQGKGLLRSLSVLFFCLALLFSATPQSQAAKPFADPLEPPANLAAAAISENRIDLSWQHSTSQISGFSIERSEQASSGFAEIATLDSASLSYSDAALSAGATYYYRARAFKQRGKNIDWSSYSETVSATTPAANTTDTSSTSDSSTTDSTAEEAPPAPVLESVEVSGTDFILTWSQPDSSYGAPDGGYDVFVDGVDQNNHIHELSTTISGLPAGTHTFSVEARFTEINEFPRSNEMSATSEDTSSTTDTSSDTTTSDASLSYLPVFPGAQGFGTETKAGRGGKIIKVTNLEDSGSGSLRAAVNASGPRMIVFEVSGTIKLGSDLKITEPYVTIAGQTAPSPGITLRGAALSVHAHDVLVQHLRVRVGDDADGPDPGNRDGIRISGSKMDVYNVVLDHLSVSWAIDETGSSPYAPHEITISNSILSEGLNDSIHPQGTHSKGYLVREDTMNMSLVGNLLAHNKDRNPRVTGNSKVVAVNNLLYNAGRSLWFDVDSGRASEPHLLSVVGNVFIEGPNTPHYAWPILVDGTCASGTKVYHLDNVAAGDILKYKTSFDPRVSAPPVWHESLNPIAGKDVEERVLSYVGARPADRDSVDARVVNEVKSRSGAIIDSTAEVGGWPNLAKNTRTFSIPSDPHGDDDGDGYTNIEEILHQMAAQVEGRSSL